jgi:uncharacterized protein (DUF58 family)
LPPSIFGTALALLLLLLLCFLLLLLVPLSFFLLLNSLSFSTNGCVDGQRGRPKGSPVDGW